MMTCPKCGFEQPSDQFCAKCGVNVETYKRSVSLGTGLKSLLKPVIFVLILIGSIFFLFKSVENKIVVPEEIEVAQSTQIGSGARSLKNTRKAPTAIQPMALKNRSPSPSLALNKTEKKEAAPAIQFNQVQMSFSLGEQVADLTDLSEGKTQNWHLTSQPNLIFSSNPEEAVLKLGNNTFEYVDELITYDINFFIEQITDKEVKLRLNLKRTLRTLTAGAPRDYAFSMNEKVPLNQTLIITDILPRRASIDRPNSILSTLYKSELFLSRASEFAQIIKFENPSNSPQEQLQ